MKFKSFQLFWRAVKSTRHEMWISLQLLLVSTLILSLLLFIVEHHAQPEVFHSYWDALLWSFMGYIGDPGEFATYTPITFWGRVLKICCALVNIAIFAVPAGLVAGGFSDAIADDKREQENKRNLEKLRQSFKPEQCRHTYFKVVPAYKSIASLQVKHGLTDDEIISAVEFSDKDDLRLRNLADSYPPEAEAQDRLIVEMFPTVGAKDYGCFINRGSNVTVVATSGHSLDEIGSSRFGFLLAKFGGFNFMSRDFDEDSHSYFTLPIGIKTIGGNLQDTNGKASETFKHFFNDLKQLSEGKDHWVILVNQFARDMKAQLCFTTIAKTEAVASGSTVIDEKTFSNAYGQIRTAMESHAYALNAAEEEFDQTHPIKTDLNTCYKAVAGRNLGVLIGGGETTNVFTLRVASSLMVRDRRIIPVALKLAEIMRNVFVADDSYIVDHTKQWKANGIAYN